MTPKKILAIKLRALGDTLLTTAPLQELRQAFPLARIDLLIPQPWAHLLEGHPDIQTLWTYERAPHPLARAGKIAWLARALRQEKYDTVVNFHASPSSAWLAYASGAPVRSVHFHGHSDQDRFSTVTIPGKGTIKPVLERDMDTLRALGIHVPAGRLPSLPLQPSELRVASEALRELELGLPLLAISLGASRGTKQWPTQRWADLAIEWAQNEAGFVLILTGPNEDHLLKQFLDTLDEQLRTHFDSVTKRSELRKRVKTLSAPPLRKLAAVLSLASVWAGSDSGPKHLAVAVQTPTVTLFGPEDPFEWHPYPLDRNPYLFRDELTCRRDEDPGMPAWCGLQTCKIEDHRCMRLIGVEAVLAACKKIARRAPVIPQSPSNLPQTNIPQEIP